ncbi:hypothetical protein [Cellulomonas sp. APG4]|uniref:hypothetical protein n=1 Tax=Cellulomonas sp. APG4 TaxID=1538656 RepID=UPI00192A3097|nr:hypothetical protein [Cellulomonas sp. APG4]
MTTATRGQPTSARADHRTAPRTRPTAMRVLRAEWTKLTSVPAHLWLALGTVAAAATTAFGLGMFVDAADGRSGAWVVTSGFVLAQIGFVVLGGLVGTSEYVTGTARTTFTAVPRRLPVLAAQVLVTLVASLTTAVLALGASYLATTWARAAEAPPLDLAVPGTGRALAGFALAAAAYALLGLALGALLRHPAAAIVGGLMLTLVGDQMLATNPGRVTDTIRAFLPSAGSRLLQDDAAVASLDAARHGPDLGTWGGGAVVLAWVVLTLAAAAYRLRRHDVR